MTKSKTVHTRPLGENRYRDLQVYYDKGGAGFWSNAQKPKGVYFAVHLYTRDGGTTSWQTGQKGDGYFCITPLDTYRPTALKAVWSRVEDHSDLLHDLLDADRVQDALSVVAGTVDPGRLAHTIAA